MSSCAGSAHEGCPAKKDHAAKQAPAACGPEPGRRVSWGLRRHGSQSGPVAGTSQGPFPEPARPRPRLAGDRPGLIQFRQRVFPERRLRSVGRVLGDVCESRGRPAVPGPGRSDSPAFIKFGSGGRLHGPGLLGYGDSAPTARLEGYSARPRTHQHEGGRGRRRRRCKPATVS